MNTKIDKTTKEKLAMQKTATKTCLANLKKTQRSQCKNIGSNKSKESTNSSTQLQSSSTSEENKIRGSRSKRNTSRSRKRNTASKTCQ